MSSLSLPAVLAAFLIAPASLVAQRGDNVAGAAAPGAVAQAAAARIRPGDRVVVRVWREPELSDSAAMVNERAEVAIPRIGLVSVTEHTPATLRDWLRGQYATFLRDPVVDVSVLRRVVVNGEVNRPGIYHADITTTLRDVIALAGGISPGGAWRKVTVVRGDERIPIRDWTKDAVTTADLRSGDQVLVGRKNWFANNALGLIGTSTALLSVLIALRR